MGALTRRGTAVLVVGCLLVLAGVVLGVVDLTRVGVLLVGLPLIARFLVRRRAPLAAERVVSPGRVEQGRPAAVELTVRNTGRAASPLLLAEEQVGSALGDRPRLLVSRLGPEETRRLAYRVRSETRGRHALGPLGVRVGDAFGLASREQVLPGTSSLTVLPRIVPLDGLPPAAAGAGGEETRHDQVALHGESDVGVREYHDGDDLRRIHWPSTARTGSMMVRQDEQPARRRVLVLLDTRARVHSAGRGAASLEWAVSAAASVVVHLLSHDLETYLATSEHPELAHAPLASLDEALDVLAVARPSGAAGAAGLVDAAADLQAHGALTCIGVLGPLEEDEVDRLTHLGPGMVLVVDPTEPSPGTASVTARRLAAEGWHAVDVTDGAQVADLWAALLRRPAARR